MDKSKVHLQKLSVYANKKTIATQLRSLKQSVQRHSVKQLDIYSRGNVAADGKTGCGICLLLPSFTGLRSLNMLKESLSRKEGYEYRIMPHLLRRAPLLEHLVVCFVNISRVTEKSLAMPQHPFKFLELSHFYCDSAKQLREFSPQ
ncbi:hypothetical protein [Parasitella parasitica]|uniref:Uncharacterized protein n=1 Tax=Parasitella parasitica TaxID=35722 RepID=A0A0B7N790_9FUNG|nr:hypothetical protein [Parasitella parasitica]